MKRSTWMSVLTSAMIVSPVIADNVSISTEVSGYSDTGADVTLSVSPADGESFLVIVGVSGSTPRVNDVTLVDDDASPEPPADFINVGAAVDPAGQDTDIALEIWKLDNKSIENNEALYDEIQVDVAGADRTYAYVFGLDDQNIVDIVRKYAANHEEQLTRHDVVPFVLEPDAMVISAHFYANAASGPAQLDCSGNETQDWDHVVGTENEGIFVQHALPNAVAPKAMTATTSVIADSISCAVVIRSDDDIVHTPPGSPGTLGGGSTNPDDGDYWLEGLTATAHGSRELLDDPGDYGSYINTDKATWIRGNTVDGKMGPGFLQIGPGDMEIDPRDFSPLNPDREADFEKYLAGLEEALTESLEPGSQHEHIGPPPDFNWTDYGGVVLFDLEFFFLDYEGAVNGAFGGEISFDPTETGTQMDPWEYNAAVRYFWERVHQWFVHVYAYDPSGPQYGVEALLFYHHPHQPGAARGLELEEPWNGMDWEADVNWVYKMQGAFDGHCYPPQHNDLTSEADVKEWAMNVMEHFQSKTEELGVYCYITHWPSRPNVEWYQQDYACLGMVKAAHALRSLTVDPWTDFDQLYQGPIPHGLGYDNSFLVTGVNLNDPADDEFVIAGENDNLFDPIDGTLDIVDANNGNNGTYRITSIVEFGGNTIIAVQEEITSDQGKLGTLETPAKDLSDFQTFWNGTGQNGVVVKSIDGFFDGL